MHAQDQAPGGQAVTERTRPPEINSAASQMPLRQHALGGGAVITPGPLGRESFKRSQHFPKPRFGNSLYCGGEYRLLMVPGPFEQFPAGIGYEDLGALVIGPRGSSADETFNFEGFKKLKR